jgi:hypothetical protein
LSALFFCHLSSFLITSLKGLGYEAWLYAMVLVTRCLCCLQWGSTIEEIAAHIAQSRANGQIAVSLLRDELSAFADVHFPLTNGGVLLHKLQRVMHDTCHTANKTKTARLSKVVP